MQNFTGKPTPEHPNMSFRFRLVVLYLLIVTLIETSSAFETLNDAVEPMPRPSLLASETNALECFPKSLLFGGVFRERRASISRPYFQQWRGSQEENRLGVKKFPAHANRVGKRSYTVDNEQTSDAADASTFLAPLTGHLSKQLAGTVYEDATTICFSPMVNDAWVEEVLDQLRMQQHRRDVQDQPNKSPRSFAFRYRWR